MGYEDLHKKAYDLLEKIWTEIKNISEEEIYRKRFLNDNLLIYNIRAIIRGRTKSFRYALLTQVLAKLANSSLNALALQRQAGVPGAFDARSFCRKVVVVFEREHLKGVLGNSDDPYVSKPLRHPLVSLDIIQHIKDKEGWKRLYHVLKIVQDRNDISFTEKVLRQILLEVRRVLREVEISEEVPLSSSFISAFKLKQIVDEFLSKPSEGARAQAIIYALMRILNERTNTFNKIVSTKSTVADEYAKRLVDIECFNSEGNLKIGIAVTENLDLRKLKEELDKAVRRKIKRLIIVAYRVKVNPETLHRIVELYEVEYKIDIIINSLTNFILLLTTLLNNRMRIQFLEEVRKVLNELGYIDHLLDWYKILKRQNII